MAILEKIQQVPIAYVPQRGAEVVAHWGATGPLADLLAGVAGCSPYLAGLLVKEAEWLSSALSDPNAVDRLLLDLTVSDLRQAKRRIAAFTALADLSGAWSLGQVTKTLTDLADISVDLAVQAALDPMIARGKLPDKPGHFTLAMGKMGAFELNYSSDIDLICLFDDTGLSVTQAQERRSHLVRATRTAMQNLSQLTADGYVFRTDLRLRPDPSVTPVCVAASSAERYYESVGRAWERAAFIKARVAAGDRAAGQRFLDQLRPFVWRRHLDFVAIEEAHALRLKIRDAKGLHGPITLPGHNMKLGRGGIREIEFYTQTRQLIAGGRDPSLRATGTCDGLAALTQAGWVEAETAQTLTQHYISHRTIEHRLQMIRDAQTHDLPHSEDGMERLAALMGTSPQQLLPRIKSSLEDVHRLTEDFFEPKAHKAQIPTFEADLADGLSAAWPSYPALRSERASQVFDRVGPAILNRLSRATDPQNALRHFDSFLKGLPAGVQVFTLFDANPVLVDLLCDICATSPALADYLGRNAAVLDAVIAGEFFAPWPGQARLEQTFAAQLQRADGYEAALDAARVTMQEWHFRIGVHHLRGLISAQEASTQYTDLARATLCQILPLVLAQLAQKHGAPPAAFAVLGLGSLGAAEMTAASDLDLMVIYRATRDDVSDGRKPLDARGYATRLTQALITALSAPMARGRLYEVDMRLRPSGRAGPVATSITAFARYQAEDAWIWEHLALCRAGVVASTDQNLTDTIKQSIAQIYASAQAPDTVLAAVLDMYDRLQQAKPRTHAFVVKLGPGGLQQIELAGQMLAYFDRVPKPDLASQFDGPVAKRLLDDAQRADLLAAARLLKTVRVTQALLVKDPSTRAGQGGDEMLQRETGSKDVPGAISAAFATAQTVLDALAKKIETDL